MGMFRKTAPPPEETSGKGSTGLRINLFFFSTFIIFCVIIVRLAILQFVEGPTLSEEETSRDTKNVPLAPMRGSILAAGGEKIAYSTPIQSLYITLTSYYAAKETDKETGQTVLTQEARAHSIGLAARLVSDFKKYGDPAAEPLNENNILNAMDLYFRKYSGYTPRRLKSGLTPKEVAYFLENRESYPGIAVVEENLRHYDKDSVAAQAVGYIKPFRSSNTLLNMYKNILSAMGRDGDPGLMYKDDEFVGFDGLEMQYQRELRGRNGYQVVSVTPQNMAERIEETVPPVKGNDIWMTINKSIQLKTEQAILDQIAWLHTHPVQGKTHPNVRTGYAVAMEIDTGHVVAMASMPDYDTNIWTSGSMPTDVWNSIVNNYQNGTITPISSGQSRHGFRSNVLMGSTIKPLSVLIGLNEKLFTTSTVYQDKGITSFGREGHETFVRNASNHVYGSMDPSRAIEQSSNVFMVDMVGKRLFTKYPSVKGVEVWDTYMKEFGLGVQTGVDLPLEHRGQINYTNIKTTGSYQAALVYASFGQQGYYTPIQLVQYAATIATEGKRIKPQMVSRITDQSGAVVKSFQRQVQSEVKFDKSYWREIIRGMNSKVDAFEGFPYDFARKTGTSQQEYYENGRKYVIDNGVFIAFAPRENPKLAVAVIIPEGGFGSSSAAPVARKIFDAYDWEYGLNGVPRKTQQPAAGASAAPGSEQDAAGQTGNEGNG